MGNCWEGTPGVTDTPRPPQTLIQPQSPPRTPPGAGVGLGPRYGATLWGGGDAALRPWQKEALNSQKRLHGRRNEERNAENVTHQQNRPRTVRCCMQWGRAEQGGGDPPQQSCRGAQEGPGALRAEQPPLLSPVGWRGTAPPWGSGAQSCYKTTTVPALGLQPDHESGPGAAVATRMGTDALSPPRCHWDSPAALQPQHRIPNTERCGPPGEHRAPLLLDTSAVNSASPIPTICTPQHCVAPPGAEPHIPKARSPAALSAASPTPPSPGRGHHGALTFGLGRPGGAPSARSPTAHTVLTGTAAEPPHFGCRERREKGLFSINAAATGNSSAQAGGQRSPPEPMAAPSHSPGMHRAEPSSPVPFPAVGSVPSQSHLLLRVCSGGTAAQHSRDNTQCWAPCTQLRGSGAPPVLPYEAEVPSTINTVKRPPLRRGSPYLHTTERWAELHTVLQTHSTAVGPS